MTSHAGGNDEQSGISWYIYDTRVDAGGKIIKPLLFLGWDGELHIEASMNCEALWIQVSCLCNSIKCKNCKNTRLMPGSCVWNLEDDYFAHVPNLTGIKPCSKCGSSLVKD